MEPQSHINHAQKENFLFFLRLTLSMVILLLILQIDMKPCSINSHHKDSLKEKRNKKNSASLPSKFSPPIFHINKQT